MEEELKDLLADLSSKSPRLRGYPNPQLTTSIFLSFFTFNLFILLLGGHEIKLGQDRTGDGDSLHGW